MADNDDKPTADEVDEVELEDARGGAAAGRHSIEEDQAKGNAMAGEDPDPAKAAPLQAEDPLRGD